MLVGVGSNASSEESRSYSERSIFNSPVGLVVVIFRAPPFRDIFAAHEL